MPRILRYGQLAVMIISVCLLFSLVGSMVHQETGMTKAALTVIVDQSSDPYRELPKLMPGEIQQITQIDGLKHEYRVVVRTKRPLESLLEMLRGSPKIIDAKIN